MTCGPPGVLLRTPRDSWTQFEKCYSSRLFVIEGEKSTHRWCFWLPAVSPSHRPAPASAADWKTHPAEKTQQNNILGQTAAGTR